MKRVQAFGGLVLLMAFGVTRAGTPSVGDLIDAEATRTLHQMTNDDKSSANGGPLPGGAAWRDRQRLCRRCPPRPTKSRGIRMVSSHDSVWCRIFPGI